jgi:hypothetical protein
MLPTGGKVRKLAQKQNNASLTIHRRQLFSSFIVIEEVSKKEKLHVAMTGEFD